MKKRILPKLVPLPKPRIGQPIIEEEEFPKYCGKERIIHEKYPFCFWCEIELEFHTRDHIIPRWLGGKNTKSCCITCNNERSKISTLARGIKKGLNSNFHKFLNKIIPLIEKYRELIKSKLKDEEAKVCLEEIEIITNHFKGVFNERSSISTCQENPCESQSGNSSVYSCS